MTMQPRQSYAPGRTPDQWTAADYGGRRELLWECLRFGGGATAAELVHHFKADRHEIVAKLKSLRTDGRVTYDDRHKWWSAR